MLFRGNKIVTLPSRKIPIYDDSSSSQQLEDFKVIDTPKLFTDTTICLGCQDMAKGYHMESLKEIGNLAKMKMVSKNDGTYTSYYSSLPIATASNSEDGGSGENIYQFSISSSQNIIVISNSNVMAKTFLTFFSRRSAIHPMQTTSQRGAKSSRNMVHPDEIIICSTAHHHQFFDKKRETNEDDQTKNLLIILGNPDQSQLFETIRSDGSEFARNLQEISSGSIGFASVDVGSESIIVEHLCVCISKLFFRKKEDWIQPYFDQVCGAMMAVIKGIQRAKNAPIFVGISTHLPIHIFVAWVKGLFRFGFDKIGRFIGYDNQIAMTTSSTSAPSPHEERILIMSIVLYKIMNFLSSSSDLLRNDGDESQFVQIDKKSIHKFLNHIKSQRLNRFNFDEMDIMTLISSKEDANIYEADQASPIIHSSSNLSQFSDDLIDKFIQLCRQDLGKKESKHLYGLVFRSDIPHSTVMIESSIFATSFGMRFAMIIDMIDRTKQAEQVRWMTSTSIFQNFLRFCVIYQDTYLQIINPDHPHLTSFAILKIIRDAVHKFVSEHGFESLKKIAFDDLINQILKQQRHTSLRSALYFKELVRLFRLFFGSEKDSPSREYLFIIGEKKLKEILDQDGETKNFTIIV